MNDDIPQVATGAHPSLPDYRDVKAEHYAMATPTPVSYTDDLSEIPVTMQNRIGICTANLCYIVENLYRKRGINIRLSRRFLYTVTKRFIDQNTNEGSSLRSVLKAVYNYGIAPESMVPTDTTLTHEQFISEYQWTPEVWQEALKYRIGGYMSVKTDRNSIADAIYQHGALYVRMEVGKEWYTSVQGVNTWDSAYILPLRKPAVTISGHAIVDFSYDMSESKTHNIIRNSWSEAWGNKGNGDFYLEDYAPYFTEAWAVTLEPIVNTLPKPDDFKYKFSANMTFGDTSEDVKHLQIFLKMRGYFDYPYITGFYGQVTKKAVYQFQLDNVNLNLAEKYIYKGNFVGPKTIAVINKLIGS